VEKVLLGTFIVIYQVASSSESSKSKSMTLGPPSSSSSRILSVFFNVEFSLALRREVSRFGKTATAQRTNVSFKKSFFYFYFS